MFDFSADRRWLSHARRFDIAAFERLLQTEPEDFWQEAGFRRALEIFRQAAERVPAYREFLKQHGVDPRAIRSVSDFAQIPLIDKKNYIEAFPLSSRCWDGDLSNARLVAMSSGASGQPLLWPRGSFSEFEAAVTHELLYRSIFEIDRFKTLLIIGFPMGVYVSGVATAIPSWLVSQKGYPLTVACVGNDKTLLLKTLLELGGGYEQIVIVGHPFFTKDVLEELPQSAWPDPAPRMRLMFCSEGFSETWRGHVLGRAGESTGLSKAINTYGCTELLLIAYETPSTIHVRRQLEDSQGLKRAMLDGETVPNLFQYNPLLRYIEASGEELAFTAAAGIPLVRYNLHDRGRLIPFSRVRSLLEEDRVDWPCWNLPLLAMWGRSDRTVVYQAVNLYPDHIRVALDRAELLPSITGKFVMRKQCSDDLDEGLEIHVELRPGLSREEGLRDRVRRSLVDTLLELNLEYRDAWGRIGTPMEPRVVLWPYRHKKYFKTGLKPTYIAE